MSQELSEFAVDKYPPPLVSRLLLHILSAYDRTYQRPEAAISADKTLAVTSLVTSSEAAYGSGAEFVASLRPVTRQMRSLETCFVASSRFEPDQTRSGPTGPSEPNQTGSKGCRIRYQCPALPQPGVLPRQSQVIFSSGQN